MEKAAIQKSPHADTKETRYVHNKAFSMARLTQYRSQ